MYVFYKALLPFFIMVSYFVVPVFAQNADDGVMSSDVMQESAVDSYSNPQTGLCEISSNYMKDHPELDGLTQGDLLAAGTEFDITKTVLRLIPLNQNCSAPVTANGESCFMCRDGFGNPEMPMKQINGPVKLLDRPRASINVCPKGPGTCATKMLVLMRVTGPYSFRCEFSQPDGKPPRWPLNEPMRSSPLFSMGVKIKVPCGLLKPKVPASKSQRRPW